MPSRPGSAPSIKDVANLAGVSVGTVSNALNCPEKVSPALVKKVLDAIKKTGYVRNEAARQLRLGHSRTIGLIVPRFYDPFFADFSRGVETAAAKRNLSVLAASSGGLPEREADLFSLFEEYRVAGIVLSPHDAQRSVAIVSRSRTATVLATTTSQQVGLSTVAVDNFAVGQLAAQHLMERQSTRVIVVSHELGAEPALDEREEGALSTLKEQKHINVEIVRAPELSVNAGRTIGEDIMSRPSALKPDAIFATHDLWAIGILYAFEKGSAELGKIAVVGTENTDSQRITPLALSSIELPAYSMGIRAVEQLFPESGSSRNPAEHTVMAPTLISRAT
jgi:LacI family transcriptional regulator